MIRWHFLRKASLLAVFVLLIASSMSAQVITGEITGTIKDPSGALIPSATVIVTNTDTHKVVRTLHANTKGEFVAPLLQVGTYSVSASAKGFSPVEKDGIAVDVSSSVRTDLTLTPGEATTVTVTDVNQLTPDLESGAVGSVISGDEMKDLALNTRNFEQMVQLQPGVVYGGSSDQLYTGLVSPDGQRNSAALSINGLRSDQNAMLLDGMDMLEHNTGQSAVIFPAIEAIDQLKVLRNSYGAQYGGGGNAQISVVTRAGGSVYHGDAHVFARNAIFNANDYFNNLVGKPRPQDSQYTGGFTLGGPLFIPHLLSKASLNTFFFYALEIKRDQVQRVNNITNIPTPAMISGNFTESVCYAYTNFAKGTCANGATGTAIPLTNFDPVAVEYIQDVFSKFPVPNNPNDVNGIIIDAPNSHTETEHFVRLDRAFGSRMNAFFRFVYDPVSVASNQALYASSLQQFSPEGIPGISNSAAQSKAYAYLLHATYALTSATVIDGSLSYEPYDITSQPTAAFASVNSPHVKINLPYNSQLARLPTITITPGTYGSTGPKYDHNETFQASSNLYHTIGRHSISMGVNWELYREAVNQGLTNAGQFKFTNSDFQQSFADFITGHAVQFTQSSVDPVSNPHIHMFEGYIQDDWKVLPRLTINVGVRYTFFHAPTSTLNNIGSFEPSFYNPQHAPTIDTAGNICLAAPCLGGGMPNPNYDPLNGIVRGGINSPFGSAVSSQPVLNFAPRVGFALDVYGDGKTALKGGYGLYFDQSQLNIVHQAVYNNPAYVQVLTINNPASFANPTSAVNNLNPSPLPAYGIAGHWKTPYTAGYSLEIDQQFSHEQLVSIAYSGNVTKHLAGQIDINQPYQGEYIKAGIGNPGGSNAANLLALNQIRPFLGYEVVVSENPVFIANYNSLQTAYNRRIGGSSRFSMNYTWSKALTDSQGTTTPDGNLAGAPQNSYCIMCDYGPVNFDRRHVFTAHYVYFLPFYRRSQHGFYQHLVGGFELAGIITAAGGLQLTPKVANSDPAGVGVVSINSPETERPNQVINPNDHAPHTRTSWIGNAGSAASGLAPLAYVPAPPALGLSGNAKVGSVRGPGYVVFNLSVFKNITIKDRQTLQLRVQAFNALNHTNWQKVAMQMPSAAGGGNFGQVTAARDPREMELGIKYVF